MTKVQNGDIRMDDWLQHHEEDTDVEQKWHDIKNILRTTAEESSGKKKITYRRIYLKILDKEIK
jgi:hypothetical protein